MSVQYLKRKTAPALAYVHSPAGPGTGQDAPMVVFMGGYRSDMNGTKATFLEECCRARGQAYLRFDYTGHGLSEGRFEDGTIGGWTQDALDIIDYIAPGGMVIVGSSMGGWIGLLALAARPSLVRGFVGIAAAPDFTHELYGRLDEAGRRAFEADGYALIPSDYSPEPYHFSKTFYEESLGHFCLGRRLPIDYPARLIQGMKDADVPWQTALSVQKIFSGGEVDVVFVEDGDHRLSRPQDLELIDREVRGVCGVL